MLGALAMVAVVAMDGNGRFISPGAPLTLFPTGQVPGERAGFPTKNESDGNRVSDVSVPTLTPYLVKNATAAVVICPGGAYEFLSWDSEGTDVAAWLNSLNISAFILKYRVPARPWCVLLHTVHRQFYRVDTFSLNIPVDPNLPWACTVGPDCC